MLRVALRRLMVLLVLTGAFLSAMVGTAFATTAGQTLVRSFDTAAVLTYLVGTALPLLVAYFTKATMSEGVKGLVLLVLAGVSSVLSQWLESLKAHVHFAWQTVVVTAIITFLVGAVTHGYWRASDLYGRVQVGMGVRDRESAPARR